MPASVLQKPLVQTPLAHCVPSVHGRPLHAPPGHSDATVHGLPPFVPPLHRPESGQSALVPQGVAAVLLHVSQKHLSDVNPTARQFGLAVDSVRVRVPVEFVRSIGNVASTPPDAGGQSRLVLPQNRFGDEPLMSHVWLKFCPLSHVPPRVPSFAVASPMHLGHGPELVGPEYTREMRFAVVEADPVSAFAVPVIRPLI
jgi:hypothetical protein